MEANPEIEQAIEGALSDAIEEVNETLDADNAVSLADDAELFGGGSPLDSIALVNFVVAVEQGIEDRMGRSIVLASDKAMSRRTSPFRTVGALRAYLRELLTEKAR